MIEGRDLVAKHFPEFNSKQLDLLQAYVDALLETNKVINLISRKNEDEVWVNHILHSLIFLVLFYSSILVPHMLL